MQASGRVLCQGHPSPQDAPSSGIVTLVFLSALAAVVCGLAGGCGSSKGAAQSDGVHPVVASLSRARRPGPAATRWHQLLTLQGLGRLDSECSDPKAVRLKFVADPQTATDTVEFTRPDSLPIRRSVDPGNALSVSATARARRSPDTAILQVRETGILNVRILQDSESRTIRAQLQLRVAYDPGHPDQCLPEEARLGMRTTFH